MRKTRVSPNYRRRVLRLPDLDHCKSAVLNSLGSPASRRVYEYAIDQFITWYCSEPRLAFNRIVVVRYRLYLESRHLAANTINQQLAAVRRLAHEAADSGLLSPELAAGISRVKGVKQLGFRAGSAPTLLIDEAETIDGRSEERRLCELSPMRVTRKEAKSRVAMATTTRSVGSMCTAPKPLQLSVA
jgi:hypothetical protein